MNLQLLGPTLRLLAAQPDLNMFVISLHLDWIFGLEEGKQIERIGHYLAEEGRRCTNGKPLVVVWRQYQSNPAIRQSRQLLEKNLLAAGIPVYEGLDRAVSALSKAADYYSFRDGWGSGR
jgi:acyl-CoA synthetase (NDP forming)